MDIGERIRRLRLERGLTQQQLADPRYSHAYVSAIEAGRRQPTATSLAHFASRLGVDVDELRLGKPNDTEERVLLAVAEACLALSRGEIDAAAEVFRSARDTAEEFGLTRVLAKAMEGLGRCREQRNDHEGAIEIYEEALELTAALPSPTRTPLFCGLARCSVKTGDLRYGTHLLENHIDELKVTNDPTALAYAHGLLIPLYMGLGMIRQAGEASQEALRLLPLVDDPIVIGTAHVQSAQTYLADGHPELARESLARADDVFAGADLTMERGVVHLALGWLRSRTGDLDEAARALYKAVEIFESTGRRDELGNALMELARVERQRARTDVALGLLDRSLDVLDGTEHTLLGWAHREVALCVMETDTPRAFKSLHESLQHFELADAPLEAAHTSALLGDLYLAEGENHTACAIFRAALANLPQP